MIWQKMGDVAVAGLQAVQGQQALADQLVVVVVDADAQHRQVREDHLGRREGRKEERRETGRQQGISQLGEGHQPEHPPVPRLRSRCSSVFRHLEILFSKTPAVLCASFPSRCSRCRSFHRHADGIQISAAR
ncbi:hypothetical protein EYF80_018321 [Liparis tanakae]|uniref:Uncharacterized protein n=1 Tax=Liparis tanakae TaxID=230148 RepID=A0A4Z2I0K3_9TELE|nr:hypothetical protein EYF80_018321 [Liparis tanakae]